MATDATGTHLRIRAYQEVVDEVIAALNAAMADLPPLPAAPLCCVGSG